MLIDIIAGARPNFIKIAPIIEAIKKAQGEGRELSFRLIHTGQHYDKNMSGSFFEELSIPQPEYNLEIGSGTQAEQAGRIMIAYERILLEQPCDLCIVVGDVTSTMACAIAAKKINNIKVAHVEAGIRSGDRTMPEEINRIVTDSITDYFFTTTEIAGEQLYKSGIGKDQVFFVGNTMIDTLRKHINDFKQPAIWNDLGLEAGEYIILTLHRPSNVDDPAKLKELLDTIVSSSRNTKLIFPVHPRTAKILENIGFKADRLFTVEPLSYLEFNYLVKQAKAVITDSGGITEETTVMGIPCMTLRNTTERPETCTIGTNELLGTDPVNIPPALDLLFSGKWKKGNIPDKWDGKTAKRIVDHIVQLFQL